MRLSKRFDSREKSGVRRAAVARASILRTRAIPDEVLATCPIETARRSGVRVRAYLRDARAAAEGGGLARLDSDGGGERGDGGHGGGDVNARAWECLARAHWYTSAARKQVSENGYIRSLRLETHTIKYLKWSASSYNRVIASTADSSSRRRCSLMFFSRQTFVLESARTRADAAPTRILPRRSSCSCLTRSSRRSSFCVA